MRSTTNLSNKLSVVVIGSGGQLGHDVVQAFSGAYTVFQLSHDEFDITSRTQIETVMTKLKPDVVINATAYNKVEDAEIDPTQAFLVNSVGPYLIAKVLAAHNIPLLHVSTDYVFDGENEDGYAEDSATHPINAYGASKEQGEALVRIANAEHWIVRTTGLFGIHSGSGKGYNFVTRMRELGKSGEVKVVRDQIVSPTYTKDLAQGIVNIVEQQIPYGTYHLVNEGRMSWYDFANMIFDVLGMSVLVKPITTEESGTKLCRPKCTVLKNNKLKALGVELPPLRDALMRYAKELAEAV